MKVLFLPNWRVAHTSSAKHKKQAPDVYVEGERYWFFKYWPVEDLNVTILDCGALGKIEKNFFKVHILQAIKALFIANSYDIIISHGGQSALFLAILRKVFLRKKPPHLLIDIGAITGGKDKQPILAIAQFATTKIDHIIYHTKMQEKFYRLFFPDLMGQASYIPFGVDVNFFKPVKKQKECNYILSFGYKHRDWTTLIKAYRKSKPKAKLLIIGSDQVNTHLPENVILHHALPIHVLKTLIKNSKFIIIPLTSREYAHGQMSILQTMAFGKPVITANSGSITDYLTNNKDALLYPLGDSDTLAQLITRLDRDSNLRKRIGQQGRITIEEKFNEEIMGQQIYDSVCSMIKHPLNSGKQ